MVAILAIAFFISFTMPCFASDARLQEIVVTDKQIIMPTRQIDETVYTGLEVSSKGIALSGTKAQANVYEALSILPAVVFESPDANNLATEQANVRIRGVRGYLGAMTVQGIPNYGANPIGPRAYIYEMANFSSIALYKGAVPASLGTGVGNRGGAIELRPKWASEKFGFEFAQSVGNYGYLKPFLRLDTGKVGEFATQASLAYSYTEQDKTRGVGKIAPRHNVNFTLVQPLGKDYDLKIWGNFNEIRHHNYRPLTYTQTLNPETLKSLDYNPTLTGNARQDYLYYDYNKRYHNNRDLYLSFTAKPVQTLQLNLKPYVSSEKSWIDEGTPNGVQNNPGIQKRIRDIERYGLLAKAQLNVGKHIISAGYHYEVSAMDIYTRNFRIDNVTGALLDRGFGVFAISGNSYIHSPYVKLAGNYDKLRWQAGLKYFEFRESASQGYVTQFIGGTPTLVRAVDLDRQARTYKILAPTAGMSYEFNSSLEGNISIGRNFMRPYAYMPLVNTYNRLRANFQAANITLNDLMQGFKIEQTDTVDIGLKHRSSMFEISPTVFLSKSKNLLVNVANPKVIDNATAQAVNYQQNVGKAKGIGLELCANIFITDSSTLFINPTFNKLTYDGNITYDNRTLFTDNKQVVDVPRFSLTSGLILSYQGFELVPKLRYIGDRYADAEHKEKVSAHMVADLRLSYSTKKVGLFEKLTASLELDNIFNKRYVSVINSMDDAVSGRTTYLAGSPFSIKAMISAGF